jgi:hypothetical protein
MVRFGTAELHETPQALPHKGFRPRQSSDTETQSLELLLRKRQDTKVLFVAPLKITPV